MPVDHKPSFNSLLCFQPNPLAGRGYLILCPLAFGQIPTNPLGGGVHLSADLTALSASFSALQPLENVQEQKRHSGLLIAFH